MSQQERQETLMMVIGLIRHILERRMEELSEREELIITLRRADGSEAERVILYWRKAEEHPETTGEAWKKRRRKANRKASGRLHLSHLFPGQKR